MLSCICLFPTFNPRYACLHTEDTFHSAHYHLTMLSVNDHKFGFPVQVGVDDRVSPSFKQIKLHAAYTLVQEGSQSSCRNFARYGVPQAMRAAVWERALGEIYMQSGKIARWLSVCSPGILDAKLRFLASKLCLGVMHGILVGVNKDKGSRHPGHTRSCVQKRVAG